MRLFVLSDLHVLGADDPIYASLLRLMREQVRAEDVLVLAGDIFDVFVGDKPIFLRRYEAFVRELENLSARGVEVHYIEGNHDFLVRKAFGRIPGVTVHPRDASVQLRGARFYFAHGDLVDPADFGYRALRAFFRSPMIRVAAKVLPGSVVDRIGQASSKTSGCWSRRELPPERLEAVRKLFRNFAAQTLAQGYDYVIMGHCHDLDEMAFQIEGRTGRYINVGFPREHRSYLLWSADDRVMRRETLPEPV